MRSLAPPVAFLLVLFAGTACQKRAAIPDSPPGPPSPNNASAADPAATGDKAMEAYNAKLASIILRRDLAETTWRKEEKSVVDRLPKEGPRVLLPSYERYARAVEKAAKEMEGLKPPADAVKVHEALTMVFDRLGENLDAIVGALHGDGGDDAPGLLKERKQIEMQGATAVEEAVVSSGFDLETFQKKGTLVRKG